ncbi:YDG domain-containing protein [Epilithonimonas sp. JDS]|uniref:YDG domain-containing protein n=1 Tax=Epilithonimonas sp. JDS TaxID=2902797 RepID=UPI001E2EA079|nr:YDG domain-containing protein [Epilithonimonas sp. JDS]MCD9853452.1 YDG domain-containing protein [Epilithonimonas sp. JDS]
MKIKLLIHQKSSVIRKRFVFLLMLTMAVNVWAQIEIPSTAIVTENFNTMGTSISNALPVSWRLQNSASPTFAGGTRTVGFQFSSGAPASGGLYNWGNSAGSDRSPGVMTSGSFSSPSSLMGYYKNTNTAAITKITVSYNVERYRINSSAASVQFYYSTNGSTWTAVSAGDVPTASLPTGSSAYGFPQLTVSVNNFDVAFANAVAPAGVFYLRWNINTTGSNSQGIGIDDVTVKASFVETCAAPTVSPTTSLENNTAVGIDLSGSVIAIGGANVTEVGFNYGTSSTLAGATTASTTGLAVSTVPYAFTKTLSGLAANTLYYYRAYATNNCTTPQTAYSNASGYPTFTTVSLAPISAAADNIVTDSFRANWSAPSATQGALAYTYHLEIDDNNDFSSPIYNNENLTATNYTIASLTANTPYYYRVRIKNAGGYSAWSATQTVTTSASSKPVVTASSFNGTVNVSFSQNISATNIPDSYAIVAGNNLPAGLVLNTTSGAITGIPTAAGTFTTNVTATKGAETSDPTTLTFTIAKGSQTITGLPIAITKIYGDADYALTATASSGLTVTYTSSNTDVATVTGSTVKIIGAGNATITAQQIGNANYNAASDVTQALTVNPKELTITGLVPQNKVYDQSTSVVVTGTPAYAGLVNGETFAVTGTVSWAFANKNAGADKVLLKTGNYNAPSANYTVLQPTLQATITKKDITISTITANDKAYDGTVTAVFSNVTSTGVLIGDTVTFTVSGSFSDANAGLDKEVTVLAINLLGADGGNYNIPLFPTGLTADITKVNQTITFNAVPTVNVGGTINLSTYATTTSGLPLSYSSSVPAIASISGATLTGNNMGSTIVTVSQDGNINYNAATNVQQTVDVVELPVALAQWDFFGVTSSASLTTLAATEISPSLNAASAILSRGSGAPGSAGGNSFRTTGFQNNGIEVTNTDYFQTSFTATENILSLTSIKARVIGTGTFTTTPGVQIQFAYSLNGTTYTLINSPINFIGDGQIPDMNLAGVTALQNIAAGTTVYFRFYASGRTATGGYGFSSPASEQYGLEFYGRFKPTTITWDGTAWSNFNGPDKSQNAIIDGAYTQSSTNTALEVNNLNITNNGAITILADQGITVNGDITTPDDKITIESDGSLTQTKLTNGNSANTIIAKREVNMRTSDYTYWSSPVANQVLLNTANVNAANSTGGFSQGSPNNRTYEYNEVTDTFKATADQQFVSAKGYAIRGKSGYGSALSSDELSFRGILHNGNYFIQIQKSKNTLVGGVSTEHGYNMIGNPYPSHMDFNKFYNLDNGTGTKNSDLILGKAWFWTNVPGAPANQGGSAYVANNYATYSLAGGVPATGSDEVESPIPTKFIKVAQGFIVQMRTAAPTGNTPDLGILKFDNSIRSNDSSSYFYNNNKSGESEINRYWIKLISPYNVVNTILMAHVDGATNDYDADYDSELLAVGDDSFYSKLNSQKLQIQARNNPLSSNDVINLGTKYSVNGTYKIKLGNKEGVFKANQKIYLIDKLLNTYTDITNQAYSFTAGKGTDETRFQIVYKDNTFLGTDPATKSDFEVYRDGTDYVINSSKILGQIEVYDAAGRLVISQKTLNKSLKINTSALINGVYIIKAENSGDIRTKKMIK